ncbi:MAG TPA: hypothetical protein VH834_11075 [Solirubrobacteraceae bacterium]|jgi:hypothetical protein
MSRFPRRIKTERTNTIDQHLLAEIRDELEALPLARALHSDVDLAKALRRELDDLDTRLGHIEAVCRLLARATGVAPDALDEDELALLAAADAIEARP